MVCLILIAVWPLTNYLAANIYNLADYTDVSIIALILVLVAVLTYFVAKKILKQSVDRIILPLFVCTALCFGYADIIERIISLDTIHLTRPLYIYLFTFVCLVYFAWRISSRNAFRQASKVLVCVVFVVSFAGLIKTILGYRSISMIEAKPETLLFQFHHKPNVYYILMDAYARQDTLREIANYDNESFLKKLEKKGFIVSRNAWSNYHFTKASLSATMNMSYHNASDKSKLFSPVFMVQSLRGENKVREIFRQNGYHITNVPAFTNEIGCCGNEDFCINRLAFFEAYQSFLSPTPFRHWLCSVQYVNLESVKSVDDIAPNKPKFIFIHIAQVHDAVFDESGNFLAPLTSYNISAGHVSIRYASSIKVMNLKILEFVDYIKTKDPKSIVIVQADHGCRNFPNNTDINYWMNHHSSYEMSRTVDARNFGIFTAIYLPNYDKNRYKEIRKYFSGFFTLVNTFRYIFAYLSDKDPMLLPEKAYFLFPDKYSFWYKKSEIDPLIN